MHFSNADGKMTRISIVINCFNYGRFLTRSIESVLGQHYEQSSLELIVIDDGSTDETAEVAGTYRDRIRYVWQPNQGQAAAIRHGIALATGEIICLLDADDVFYQNKCAEIDRMFGASPQIGAVYNKYDIIVGDGSIECSSQPRNPRVRNLRGRAKFWRAGGVPTSSISMRAAVARSIIFPEGQFRICADSLILYSLPFLTNVRYTERSLTGYYIHGSNLFQGKPPKDRIEQLRGQTDEIRQAVKRNYGVELYWAINRVQDAIRARRYGKAACELLNGLRFIAVQAPDLEIAAKETCKLLLNAGRDLSRLVLAEGPNS